MPAVMVVGMQQKRARPGEIGEKEGGRLWGGVREEEVRNTCGECSLERELAQGHWQGARHLMQESGEVHAFWDA